MTHDQYEQHKRRLEEQLRAGIRLLETAHQAQIRALDLVWTLQVEAGELQPFASSETPPAPSPPKEETPPPPSPPSQPRRRSIGELEEDVRVVLPRLPETFTRRDICTAICYEPDRSSLYRILQELVSAGTIRIESKGTGQIPTVYRQTGAPDASGAG